MLTVELASSSSWISLERSKEETWLTKLPILPLKLIPQSDLVAHLHQTSTQTILLLLEASKEEVETMKVSEMPSTRSDLWTKVSQQDKVNFLLVLEERFLDAAEALISEVISDQ